MRTRTTSTADDRHADDGSAATSASRRTRTRPARLARAIQTSSWPARARQTIQRTAPIVELGRQLVAAPSEVSDEQRDELRAFVYHDEQIVGVVSPVCLQSVTGAFHLVADIQTTPTARSAR